MKGMTMDINTVFSGDTLKAADLQGHEPTVIIAGVTMKKFDNGNKLVISFEGKKKTLVCNKTNAKRIASIFSTNTDLWIGNEITLYTDQVDFQGGLVDAIRVKAKRQPAARAEATPQRHTPLPPPPQMNGAELDGDEIPF
jgi:hypothetical protein